MEMKMTGVTIKTYLIEGWAHQKQKVCFRSEVK